MTEICKKDCNMVTFCKKNHPNSILADNNDVFQILYKHYMHPIYNFFCRKINYDQSTAEDLTQEAFTKVYQNLNKINNYCTIKNWIYAIANNTYIDYWRKNLRNPLQNSALDLDSINLSSDEDLPLRNLLQNEIRLKLNDIYKNLPSKYFRAIFLYEHQNYTYAQAAKIMNMSLTAYTSLLNRARIRLQEIAIAQLLGIEENLLTKKEYAAISKFFYDIQLSDDISESIKQGMMNYFNEKAELYNDFSSHNYLSLIVDYLLHKHPLKKEDIVADFGMGTGIFASRLSPYIKRVDGYDFSKEMCDLAKQNFYKHKVKNVVSKNLDFMELGDSSFKYDHVFCITVLHHVTYPHKTVEKMAKSLKKGGKLVISDFYKHRCTEMVEIRSDLWYGFTKEQFAKFLSDAGLHNIWVEIHREIPVTFRATTGKIVKIPTIIGGGEK